MSQLRAVGSAVCALALLIVPGHGSAREQRLGEQPAAACSMTASMPQRIALSDGTTLTIDASSMSRRGGDVLIAGTPTYLWPPGSTRGSAPLDAPSPFGVVRDARGRYALVPAPPGVPGAKHPRVVSAGADGWHAVFVTGSPGTPTNALAFGEAEIWYGRYDGRRWREVRRIARARGADLLPGRSSELVAARSGLAFAYAFEHGAASREGLVLLHRRGSEWREDTLPTWEAPRAVQLAPDSSGVIVAAFAQSYFDRGRPHGPALFTARHDTRWSPPQLAFDDPPRYVAEPMLPGRVHAGSVITWRSAEPGAGGASLEWGVFTRDSAIRSLGDVGAASSMDRPAVLQVDGASAVWLVRDGESRTSLRVFAAQDTTVHNLGPIQLPLDNLVTHAAPLADGIILIVSGGLGRLPSDPPGSSYLTVAAVRCTDARRSPRVVWIPSTN